MAVDKQKVANAIEKCCGKLKEVALRRITTQNRDKLKADIASKTQGIEISRVNENKLVGILTKCVGSYIKSGTSGLYSTAKHQDESAKISYAREVEVIVESKEFFYDYNGSATFYCKFKIHCPIQLDINGDELKKAIQSSSPKLKSTFHINLGLYGDKKSLGAKRNGPVSLSTGENAVGSHARGVASLFNGGGAGEFTRQDVDLLISELTEYLNRDDHAKYPPYSPIFLNTYSEVGNGNLQMILDKEGAKESNGRKEESKRYGRERIEESYTISYPVIISYKGKDIGEIPNAYTSTFTHTTQYVDDGNEYASAYETADRTWSHTNFDESGSLQNDISKLLQVEGLM